MGQTHFKHKLHTSNLRLKLTFLGSGGVGQVVSMLAFYFDDSSSNPAEVYSFNFLICLKISKINKKRPWMAYFKKQNILM